DRPAKTVVTTPSEDAGGGDADDTASPAGDWAEVDTAGAPSADWVAVDPVLPPAHEGDLHEFVFDATEVVMEVAPGVEQEMWTFNDIVPGPTLRGKVGDTFRITLNNKGNLGHSLDFHASMVSWDDQMRTIGP